MRHVVAIIAVIFLAYSCQQAGQKRTSSQADSDQPQIKSCKIYSYNLKDNNLEEGVLIEEFEYNENGLETKLVRYDTTGEIICSFTYKYDQSGNLTEKIWMEARESSTSNGEHVDLSFDSDREVKMVSDADSDNATYDKTGKLVERIWNDPSNDSEIKETHHYYEDGREVEIMYYNDENELERKTVHIYDSLGNETSLITYNKDGKVIDKLTYSYDEYGNIKEDVYWNVKLDTPEQIIRYVYEYY